MRRKRQRFSSSDSQSDREKNRRKRQKIKLQEKQKHQLNQKNGNSLFIEINKYAQNYTINPHQMFLKQNLKPIQRELKEYLQKILQTKEQRKKYSNAIKKSINDMKKVQQQINKKKLLQFDLKKQSDKVADLQQLLTKIDYHLQLMMSEEQKTIQSVREIYERMLKTFDEKIRYQFLDLSGIKIRKDQQSNQEEVFQEIGIVNVYEIMEEAKIQFEELTGFKGQGN